MRGLPPIRAKEDQLRNLEERKVREGTEEGGEEWELRIALVKSGVRPLHRLGGPKRSLRQRSWRRRLWRKWTRRPVVRCALQPSLSHLLEGEREVEKEERKVGHDLLRWGEEGQSLRLGDLHVEVVGKGPSRRGLKEEAAAPHVGERIEERKSFRETRTWEDWGGTTSMPPKGGIRARPAARLGRGLRRPAAAPGGGAAGPPRLRSISGADWLAKGLTVFSGLYWDQPSKWVGRVVRLTSKELEPYLVVSVEGTQSEALLKYISGSERKELKVHLCGDPCEALRWQDGLAHLESIEEVPVPLEGWMQNLVAVKGTPGEGVDELEKVRKESVEAAQKRLEEVEKERKEKEGDGKKAKKKEKRRRSSSSSRKDRLKVKSRKGLGELFSHTGLDPDVRNRKRFLRKARKKMKKRKRGRGGKSSKSSSSSSGSRGGGEEATGGLARSRLFTEDSGVQELVEELPGTLSAGWL